MIECIIGNDDKVYPMVSPGGNIEDAFDENDLEKQEVILYLLVHIKAK